MNAMRAATSPNQNSLSEGGYEMVRAVVNAVRHYQFKAASSVREHLASVYPGREADIQEAIEYWYAYEAEKDRRTAQFAAERR